MRNEKDVKRRVKKLLDQYDWFWWMPPANGFGHVGISDFHAIKDGVFIAIETKFGTRQLTPQQRAFLESINAATGFGFVVNDSNLGQLESFLSNFGQSVKDVSEKKQMANEAGAALLDAIRALQMPI